MRQGGSPDSEQLQEIRLQRRMQRQVDGQGCASPFDSKALPLIRDVFPDFTGTWLLSYGSM